MEGGTPSDLEFDQNTAYEGSRRRSTVMRLATRTQSALDVGGGSEGDLVQHPLRRSNSLRDKAHKLS